MRIRSRISVTALSFGGLIAAANPALAYLGSFRPQDGYSLSVYNGSANWCDVTYYNAGAYGPNAGGGAGPTPIVPDSGQWKLQSQAGAFFPTTAARNASVGGAPPYPSSVPSGSMPIYIVGNHGPGRGGDGSSLAVRNDSPSGTGPLKYDYALDSYDFGGTNPATVTSGTLITEFYYLSDPGVAPQPGTPPQDKFRLKFKDSLGNVGVEWGYGRDNEVYWRANNGGNWSYTGLYADPGDWDGVRMSIDLGADTFMLEYYDVSTSLWTTLAAAGTPLGTALQDLTHLGWEMEDNVVGGLGGKNFFDDFSVTPEPSTLVLAAAGLLVIRRR
ncbi:hypothetical protein RAS1_18240 [Phycisphaerae bacterium RAS1]|nr:hypothetical protein RAS1_18240 [Phycisphaerae bacterium RAS1]